MVVSYKTHCPCKVFDANGLEWKHLRWVDTETGEGEQIVVDDKGMKQLNPERTAVLTQMVRMAAPVLVTPITPKYENSEALGARYA